MIEHCQEQCLPDHEHTVQTQLDSFSRSETLCTTGEATEKQSASGLHSGTALQRSLIGLQHESLWLAHRTTTVKCNKGHVRHATASEQLPLGPVLHALSAPPVPPGRDMQASEDLFMDLDEQSSRRPRDTPSSSTHQSDFDNPEKFVQSARNVSVPLPRTPVLMLSHDVSSGPECFKPVTISKSSENSGCADVLLNRPAANKEVQYDALVMSKQVRVNAAMVREWDKWNEFGVTKFLSKRQLNDIMKRNSDQKIVGTRWVFTEKTIQGKPDYKVRLVV